MKVITENSTAEIVEKKSRFIANVFYVESAEEAENKLNEVRKKYYDAKHNCYAYVIGKSGDIVKSSDDGEPQGTAGHPMLDILKGENLTNCIAIVTRYFGGILLGTGGLVRAYSDSLKAALKIAKFSNIYEGYEVKFNDNYAKAESIVQNLTKGLIKNVLDQQNSEDYTIISVDKVFEESVQLRYLVEKGLFDKFKQEISNLTKGKVILENNDMKMYYIRNKKIMYI